MERAEQYEETANQELFARFADIISFDEINTFSYHIIGCGAIGSQVAMNLYKMGAQRLFLWDFDSLEEANIGVQGYPLSMVGKPKVDALKSLLAYYIPPTSEENIVALSKKFSSSAFRDIIDESDRSSIVISCVDTMKSRKSIMNIAKAIGGVEFIVDGRMSAEVLQVYTFSPDKLDKYKETLFDDSEAHDERCTAKSTIYTASLAGSLMVGSLKYWITTAERVKEYWESYSWELATNSIRKGA